MVLNGKQIQCEYTLTTLSGLIKIHYLIPTWIVTNKYRAFTKKNYIGYENNTCSKSWYINYLYDYNETHNKKYNERNIIKKLQ